MLFPSRYHHNLTIRLLIVVTIGLINLSLGLPANALTQELQLNSPHGYKVSATFSYDETSTIEAIADRGTGSANSLNNLQVSFYNPDGSMAASYENIVDRTITGNYFEFHYDPQAQKLFGEIDLGGDSAGEIYLKGDVEQELSLIKIDASGAETAMDSGRWTISQRTANKY